MILLKHQNFLNLSIKLTSDEKLRKIVFLYKSPKVFTMENSLNILLGNTTKSTIVKILTEKNFLSLKEICEKLKKENIKEISYQATHKAINELVCEEVLEKVGKEFSINEKWINNLSELSDKLKTKRETKETEAKIYHFDTFLDMGKFLIKTLNSVSNENKKGACFTKHAWSFFGLGENDYKQLNKLLTETKFYEVIHNSTPLDKVFGKAIQDLGKIVKIGSDLDFGEDFLIKGNTLFQIHYTPEFAKDFDEIFQTHKGLENLPISKIMEKFMITKTHLTVVLLNDEIVADELRKEILNEF